MCSAVFTPWKHFPNQISTLLPLGLKSTPTKSSNSRLSMGLANRSQMKRSSMSGSVGMLNQVSGNDMTNEVSFRVLARREWIAN